MPLRPGLGQPEEDFVAPQESGGPGRVVVGEDGGFVSRDEPALPDEGEEAIQLTVLSGEDVPKRLVWQATITTATTRSAPATATA